MVIRNDFLYWITNNFRFKNIIELIYYNDNYLNALIREFNKASYKEYFKFNSNLDLRQVKFSLECFYSHLNLNDYDYEILHGVFKWKIDNNIVLSYGNDDEYSKLIDKEYLKEWEKHGYYFYKD